MTRLPDLDTLTDAEKGALILASWAQVREIEGLKRRIAELEARLGEPPKSSDNSSLPPPQGRKGNRPSGGGRFAAAVSAGLEPGSPVGPPIDARRRLGPG